MQKIEVWDYETLADLLDGDALAQYRARANNPSHPVLRGSAQNGDIFFQAREAGNTGYLALPDVVEAEMARVNARIGTDYKPFNYYGAPDAERVIVAMGSVCETAVEVVDFLNARGEKVGLVKVRLYRPWSSKRFVAALPRTVKKIAVLDRTKEPGSVGEPLYLDVLTSVATDGAPEVRVCGGRYGLASKDTTPGAILAAFKNLSEKAPKNGFTVGFLSYTYGTNGLPVPKAAPYLVSLTDTEIMRREIAALRPLCEYLVVSMHWGDEYTHTPTKRQEELAALLAELKVDLVIGHHPHVLQEMRLVKRPDGGEMLVFFSLGNFLSAQTSFATLLGGLATVRLERHNGAIRLTTATLEPLVTHYEPGYTNFRVYRLADYTPDHAARHAAILTPSRLHALFTTVARQPSINTDDQ
jgi:hypothetical protein